MAGRLEQGRVTQDARGHRACRPLVRRERTPECCFTPSTEPKRPDPAIYSQLEILERGLATRLSWNSPDINTNVAPAKLDREAVIVVRNLSTIASAANVRVDVHVHRFGIGFDREMIGGSLVSIPPAAQTVLTTPYPQLLIAGEQRIGVEVRITHSTDSDLGNNIGFQAIDWLATSAVGKAFTVDFPVRNPLAATQVIQVQSGPVDPGLSVTSPLPGPAFGPFEERLISADITVLPGVTPFQRDANFIAFDGNDRLIGGVAFVINVDS